MPTGTNYAILTDENKLIVNTLIDFLVSRQEQREQKLLDIMQEYEDGGSAGPFHSVEELMADLYA